MEELERFRAETRSWLEENCPEEMRAPAFKWDLTDEAAINPWRDKLASRGWTTPTWPSEYGGGGLSKDEARVLSEEVARIGSMIPAVSFFGTVMLGPVLLEFGNEDQKKDHLSKITSGEINWCQGYSEPGAGSDLANLQTRCVKDGDHYVINGSKIWTSGANTADWIFCLVRTDPKAPKHDGISFILFDLKQPGVTISPIKLISGSSDFCQVFFEDVRAEARNLVGPINGGWTIAKRLLQHERATLSGGMGSGNLLSAPSKGDAKKVKKAPPAAPPSYLAATAKRYVGESDGRIDDPIMRDRVAQLELDSICFGLTLRRSGEEAKAGQGPGAASSMFKLYGSEVNKRRQEIMVSLMGAQALGWEGEGFGGDEIAHTRAWLRSKGNSIEGGTSEVQLNVIAKRVLGLPD